MGRLKREMNCLLGIEIGVFGSTDGLGVHWLSDGDCLNPSREIREYRVLERPVQTGRWALSFSHRYRDMRTTLK